MNKKIKTQKEIGKILQRLKKQKKKIVTVCGSFDILHLGHIKFFQEAKQQGDVLIVMLNSDKSIRMYKGFNRPINSQKERAEVLAALESVDFIIIFNEINPRKVLEKIKPHIHCQGANWGKNCIERKIVEKHGGKISVFKLKRGFSTTDMIKKRIKIEKNPSSKAVFLDRDGTININNPEYVHTKKDFKLTLYAIQALRKLTNSNYKIIIVTNQSGIGRGYFTEQDLKDLHKWMIQGFKKKNIRIDKIYYCSHYPKENCSCRKPKPGMIFQAVKDIDIDLSKSWIIGDKDEDILMGREVNLKTIKIGKKLAKELKIDAHYYVKNLLEAVKIILS